jgi:polyferredoxin
MRVRCWRSGCSRAGYCRFLCPLGGVLAALDRLHLIDLLKRR